MHPWDAAAGVVLVREAGGIITDLIGASYDLYRPPILATKGRVQVEARGEA
jgi:myo-inositol-1(or 4)-monophosphatase